MACRIAWSQQATGELGQVARFIAVDDADTDMGVLIANGCGA